MRVLLFGTYDVRTHQRVEILRDGLRAHGDVVDECNVPIGFSTDERVRLLREPWRLVLFAWRVLRAWASLWRRRPRGVAYDAVLVGYLGHLDVHLARRLFRGVPIVLDYFISLADTASDRAAGGGLVRRLLGSVDARAVRAASVVLVDTDASRAVVPACAAPVVTVPVGAPGSWFTAPAPLEPAPLRVVFFGLYTPLQGAPVIGHALRSLAGVEVTMVGRGQDLAATRAAAGDLPFVTWREWVEPEELAALLTSHHVCLGIFGTGPKAARVVPNKVFQGAAAGCAIVTSDTPPQRAALGDAAVYVPAGDAAALAAALASLAADPARVAALRAAAWEVADRTFRPEHVVTPLREALR